MTDNSNTPPAPRIFKSGATLIREDESTAGLALDTVRAILAHQLPEVAHATVRETPQPDGTLLIEFIARPGRKG